MNFVELVGKTMTFFSKDAQSNTICRAMPVGSVQPHVRRLASGKSKVMLKIAAEGHEFSESGEWCLYLSPEEAERQSA